MEQLVRLGDVCTVVSGSTPKTSVDEYWNGDVSNKSKLAVQQSITELEELKESLMQQYFG